MNVEDIKFKAYVKEDKKIYPVDDLEFTACNRDNKLIHVVVLKDEPCCAAEFTYCEYKVDDVVLLPFTGFKDKEGTEIYEGNIISDHEGGQYIVEWDNKTASFRLTDENNTATTGRMIHERFIKNYKIIGNVWENPELLKE